MLGIYGENGVIISYLGNQYFTIEVYMLNMTNVLIILAKSVTKVITCAVKSANRKSQYIRSGPTRVNT